MKDSAETPRKCFRKFFFLKFFSKNAKISSDHSLSPSFQPSLSQRPTLQAEGLTQGSRPSSLSVLAWGWAGHLTQLLHTRTPFPSPYRTGTGLRSSPTAMPLGETAAPRLCQGPVTKPLSAHLTPSPSRLIQMLLAFLPSFPSSSKSPQIGFLNTVFMV